MSGKRRTIAHRINWGWRIVIVYVIFIAGTVSWVGFAMTQDVDLVRPDYYEHGLAHDSIIAAQARAHVLGVNASFAYDRGVNALRIQIPLDQNIAPIGSIAFYRPNAVDSDRTITFAPNSNGMMIIPLNNLARGVWKFTFDWKSAGLAYELMQTDTL